jgi:hypothetical protein
MNIGTALVAEYKRREVESVLEGTLAEAVEEERAIARRFVERDYSQTLPRKRFAWLGDRMISLADSSEGTTTDHEAVHKGVTPIHAESLSIVTMAHMGLWEGPSQSWELKRIEVQWLSGAYVSGFPLAVEELSLEEVKNPTPEVLGTLKLIEQSLEIAELARRETQV